MKYFEQDIKIKSSPKLVLFFCMLHLIKANVCFIKTDTLYIGGNLYKVYLFLWNRLYQLRYVVILKWNYEGKLFSNVLNKDSNNARFQINRQKIKRIFYHPVDKMDCRTWNLSDFHPYRPKWSSKGMYEFLHTNSSLAKGCLILENLKKKVPNLR